MASMVAFVGSTWSWDALRLSRSSCQATGAGIKKSTPKEPWKPLVFKMPTKKPPRKLEPGEDGFTLKMRERLRGIGPKVEGLSQERPVSETKVDDLINKETDDAKISGLNTMWYLDREADRVKNERENPDLEVMKRRYNGALDKLMLPKEEEKKAKPEKGGYAGTKLDVEALIERGREAEARRRASAKAQHDSASKVLAESQDSDDQTENEGIADFLREVQANSKRADKFSRRVVKSPEQRKQDYEDTKGRMSSITLGLGFLGTVVSQIMYGVNVAFSFGLGSIGALAYLSGLQNYADNADSPMGQAMGGRRLLVPVIVVLMIEGWPRIEAQVPQIADLHLQPELLPAILGFFLYTAGKVLSGVLK
eukprot:TRINITY_DN32060_c0_g1_i1.p1 TRINITY_DN32060_c0_g1~~TRINITY_DN32060_c0_g1_i1.p1  ORF type:complete len:421 (-),score=73.35 TRINITY_DN32060_c0_g1_i1:54-1151(-)